MEATRLQIVAAAVQRACNACADVQAQLRAAATTYERTRLSKLLLRLKRGHVRLASLLDGDERRASPPPPAAAPAAMARPMPRRHAQPAASQPSPMPRPALRSGRRRRSGVRKPGAVRRARTAKDRRTEAQRR